MSSYSHSTNKALNSNTIFFKNLDLLQVFQESEREKIKTKKTRAREGEREEKRQRTRKRKRGGIQKTLFSGKM